MTLHWSDIGGMDDLKQELIQTVQWRFEVQRKSFFVFLLIIDLII